MSQVADEEAVTEQAEQPPHTKSYVVQPGDTLSAIAVKIYGHSGKWRHLAKLNHLAKANILRTAQVIYYDASAKTAHFTAHYRGARHRVKVVRGDTLGRIAARVLGSASYWKVLWRYNQKRVPDPNKIYVGQSLIYVKSAALAHKSMVKKTAAPEASSASSEAMPEADDSAH